MLIIDCMKKFRSWLPVILNLQKTIPIRYKIVFEYFIKVRSTAMTKNCSASQVHKECLFGLMNRGNHLLLVHRGKKHKKLQFFTFCIVKRTDLIVVVHIVDAEMKRNFKVFLCNFGNRYMLEV